MNTSSANSYFFLFLLIISGVGVFLLFQPFLTAVVVAGVLASLLSGVHRRVQKILFGSKGWSALLVCLFAAIVIVAPLSVVLGFAVSEANSFLHSEQSAELVKVIGGFLSGVPFLGSAWSLSESTSSVATDSLSQVRSGAIGVLGAAYEGVTGTVIWLFTLFFSLFYFLIDGRRLLTEWSRFSPFHEEQDRIIFRRFASISRAMIKGSLVVALVQGALGGIAFSIAGVASPVIWGIVMSVASLVPMLGAGLVWFPTGLFLLLTGNLWQGIFVLSFGALVISLIDNLLRPKLVGHDTEMHPMLVFFATLGGISLFGFSGLLIGPIIVSLFLVFAEIYAHEFGSEGKGDGNPSTPD